MRRDPTTVGREQRVFRVLRLLLVGWLLLPLLLPNAVRAQDEETDQEKTRDRRERMLGQLPRAPRRLPTLDNLQIRAEYEELPPGAEARIYVLAGSVRIDGKEFRVRAGNVVLWLDAEKLSRVREEGAKALDEPDPDPPPETPGDASGEERDKTPSRIQTIVTRLYAEGGVEYRSGSEIIRAEQVFFDFRTNRGIVLDGFVSSYAETRNRKIALVLRAEEIRQVAEGRFRAENTSLTNCTYGEPHWEIHADQVDVDQSADSTSVHFSAKNAVVRSHGFPVFYLPRLSGNVGSGSRFYLKSLRAGKSSRFGLFVLSEWGEDIRIGEDRRKFGEWTLHLDEFQDRGFGTGLDVEYSQPGYFGDLLTYFIHDDGDEDRGNRPIERENRSRARLRHRSFLPYGVQADAELNWLSDRNFLREFFEEEFKEEKAPETVAYLKRAGDHHIFTLTGRFRLNDFQTQTEYLPRGTYDLVFEPIFDEPFFGTNLYYSQRTEAANVRLRTDEDLPTPAGPGLPNPEDRILRFDTIHRFDLPVPVGPFKVSPFHETRYSAFEETAVRDSSDERFTGTYGVTLSTKASRTFDVRSRIFKIRGLRHVITPRVSYLDTYANNLTPQRLIPFDTVDRVRKLQRFRLELRNRLQTRRGGDARNVVDLDAKIDYFPDDERDNAFFDPDDPNRIISRSWSNLDVDLLARVSRRISLRGDAEYDFFEHELPVANLQLIVQPSATVRAAIGYRSQRRDALRGDPRGVVRRTEADKTQGSFVLNTKLTEKWAAQFLERYDFEDGRNEETEILLQRIGHDWILELGFSIDEGDNDTQFSVSLQPKDLFRPGFRRRNRIGSQPESDLFGFEQ